VRSIGERALDVAMNEVGVLEDPPGSNSGKRVKEYLAPCVRGDRNTLLHLTASNWCMAFSSWCMQQALFPHEKAPHGYRAGVIEAVADVRDPQSPWSGKWHDVKEVRSGVWRPNPGDLAIYDRSIPSRPDTSWWRHVNRVISFSDDGLFRTVGGNEAQRVKVAEQTIDKVSLLGFIAYPQPKEPATKELLTTDEKVQLAHLVYLTIDGMLRESIHGQTLDEEDED